MIDHTKLAEHLSTWTPEEDPQVLSAIGKLGEEAAELAKICFRIIIQGADESDPDTSKPNLEALAEEIADVRGVSAVVIRHLDLVEEKIAARAEAKRRHKDKWISQLAKPWEGPP